MIVIGTTDKRAEWAKKIAAQCCDSVIAIIKVGIALAEARKQLPAVEFWAMVETDLPFGRRSAEMFLAIGADQRLAKHVSQMPASWGTLYELHKLPTKDFERGLRDKTINPDMGRKDVRLLVQSAAGTAPKIKPRADIKEAQFAPAPKAAPATPPPSTPARPPADLNGHNDAPAQGRLHPLIEFIESNSFAAVARGTAPGERARVREHIVVIRTWLGQLERALTHEAEMDTADADEAAASRGR